MSIIIALIMFSVLVAIHEFGHFAVAKMSGVKVNQFAIGMGPALFKFKKGETEYSLRLFPVGGYCAMEGEDDASDDSRAFRNKPVKNRLAVIFAGPFMNLILGLVLSIIITSCISEYVPTTTIAKFTENSMSEQTGLKVGDRILKMDTTRIFTESDIAYKLQHKKDCVFDLVVERNGEKVKLPSVKFYDSYYYYIEKANDENPNDHYVTFETKEEYTGSEELKFAESPYDFRLKAEEKKTFFNVLSYSYNNTVTIARLIWMSLIDLVTGQYGLNDLSGPVGIVSAIGEVRAYGLESLLNLITMITINLGIFNLLPLPALDGGRIVFLIVEALRGKPVPPEKEGMVHFVGIAILMIFMVIVTVNDVMKLF